MTTLEKILTITQKESNKVKIKGSKFLGFCYPISSENDASEILNKLKKEYYDATHHCFAYKTTYSDEKYSDDGEPNGTAGIRILNAINHFELTNIIVVIVRYFGGTKLGVGPLGKAYFDTSFELLKKTQIVELKRHYKIEIIYDYEDGSKIHRIINKYGGKNVGSEFDSSPKLIIDVPYANFDIIHKEIIEITANRSKINILFKNLFL